jgi:hypothetical protein
VEESPLCGIKKVFKVTRPSTSALGMPELSSRTRSREGACDDDDDDGASSIVRDLNAVEVDLTETSRLSFSGRFRRNSAQAGEDWKFSRSLRSLQSSSATIDQPGKVQFGFLG